MASLLVSCGDVDVPKSRAATIGRADETAAVAACKAFTAAQEIYRRGDYDRDGVFEYAQSLSGDGSLFETVAGKRDLSLIDAGMAAAEGEPGDPGQKAGYRFKVLKGQGVSAPGGQKSYLTGDGNMTGGYALVAYPASYDPGVNTFLISQSGTVYKKDLGTQTHAIVQQMTEYDPDATWIANP